MKSTDETFTCPKKYLNKSFLEELNYKIWSTKGAGFNAGKRLQEKSKYSNISLAFISAYLIIASLYSVYINTTIDEKLISYIIIALSILLLVFSQFENAQDYKLNAKKIHDCGLELSNIYNELRIYKTLKDDSDDKQYCFAKKISSKYQKILEKYENHKQIDYDILKIYHLDYFTNITKIDVFFIKTHYFFDVYFWYLLLMLGIPVCVFLML